MRKKNRPVFNKLKEKLKNNEYELIIVNDISSILKKDLIFLFYMKHKYNVNLLFVNKNRRKDLKGIR